MFNHPAGRGSRLTSLRAFAGETTGQALVVTALCMVVLIGFLGFAIDVGHLRLVKSQMQSAADAAALTAGLAVVLRQHHPAHLQAILSAFPPAGVLTA